MYVVATDYSYRSSWRESRISSIDRRVAPVLLESFEYSMLYLCCHVSPLNASSIECHFKSWQTPNYCMAHEDSTRNHEVGSSSHLTENMFLDC